MKKALHIVGVSLILLAVSCSERDDADGTNKTMAYQIKPLSGTSVPVGKDKWDEGAWKTANTIELTNFIFEKPEHFPRTRAKLLYDSNFIYVFFYVEDQYVRAIAQNNQGLIADDSCVEFFFSPGVDASAGYFNMEVNCGGTMTFRHQQGQTSDVVHVSEADCQSIDVFHSEPKIVEPEKKQPTTWVVQYSIPLALLEKYCKVVRPAPGVVWKGNFYKCAEQTSHPHWLNWAPIDKEPAAAGFHLPEFFGTLEFK